MNNKYLYSAILFLTTIWVVQAQQVVHIIQGATVHTGNGTVIPNGYVVFAEGKIVHVGDKLNAMYKNAVYVDAKGKHVYPGLICLNTLLGLNELDAVRATRDYNEVGTFNPNVRSLIAFNTDSKLTPTARFNGIMYVQPIPQGGLISGSSSIMNTAGWNWEDAVLKADDGIHLNWPEMSYLNETDKQRERVIKQTEQIESFFAHAQAYTQQTTVVETNLRYEAMRKVFTGTANVYVHVNTARGILTAFNFFKKYPGIRIVLVGAEEAYQVMDEIKQAKVDVVLDVIHRLPSKNHEPVDMPYALPALLANAGIRVALAHSGSWESRNLMFNAGTAAAYGLSKEDALKLITLNAAIITRSENEIGSIETNKRATIIITEGDILDMKSSVVSRAFIDGIEVQLNGEQQALYEKFMKKYNLKP